MQTSPLPPVAPECTAPVPCAVFVPQMPEQQPCFPAHTLLHLKVGLLNVAYASAGAQRGPGAGLFSPPVHQPLTLPLSLHLHPSLLTPVKSTAKDGSDLSDWIPPGLWLLQRSIVPTIVSHLSDMIAQVKIKKMDTLRGNRVGLIRTRQFVFTFTFRETQPAYHMLTVSAKRIRQMDKEADAKRAAASAEASVAAASSRAATASPPPGTSLSSELSSFSLFTDPAIPVRLSSLSQFKSSSGVDDGFYAGRGFASYLVSRHTLHVRLIPTRAALDGLEREREEERERREREKEEAEHIIGEGDPRAEKAGRAGDKRKTTIAASSTSTAAKKPRAASSASLDAASSLVAVPASTDDSPLANDDIPDDWLNLDE
jgi:hypothetical protein